jgi:hypothetical protein
VDTVFDDAMARFAPFGQCLHWSFAGHRGFAARSHGRVDVPDDALESLCLRFNVLVIEELAGTVFCFLDLYFLNKTWDMIDRYILLILRIVCVLFIF